MNITIGIFIYITKLHFIELKNKIAHKYTSHDFDYVFSRTEHGDLTIYQDGLVLLNFKGELDEIKDKEEWLKKSIISELKLDESEHTDFYDLMISKCSTLLILEPNENPKTIYKKFNKTIDFEITTKHLTKYFGDSMIVLKNIKLNKFRLQKLIESQIIFSEFLNLIRILLKENKIIAKEVETLRRKEAVRFKEIPSLIDTLIDRRTRLTIYLKKIMQLDEFLLQREAKCRIISILEDLKSNEFQEIVRTTYYLKDELETTISAINSTIELTQFIYEENSQKEMNILQVIFAIGTISTIVGLGAMPGARLFLSAQGSDFVGEIVAFNLNDLLMWTFISVVIGLVLFALLNYFFLYAKRLKLVNLSKK